MVAASWRSVADSNIEAGKRGSLTGNSREAELPARTAACNGDGPKLCDRLPGRLRTPLRRLARGKLSGALAAKTSIHFPGISLTSSRTVICVRPGGAIRKNIIGHGTAARREQLFGSTGIRCARGAFALLDQQAREHGAGIFFEPLIEQGVDFLFQIGSVSKAREFVALQRVARSREQELPRGLGLGTEHGAS